MHTPTETLMAVAFEHKLSAPQVWILCEARRRGGKVTTKELKNELFSRAIISYSVRKLVEKGLAKSKAVERQSLELTLLKKGRDIAQELI
jgi:DNA-binding MarR family transcriptional regulator